MSDISNPLQEIKGLSRLTDNARRIIVQSHELARFYFNQEILPLHIFISLLRNPSNLLRKVFEQVEIDIEKTRGSLEAELTSLSSHQGGSAQLKSPVFGDKVKKLVNDSFLVAESLSHVYVGSEHLLLSVLGFSEERFVRELNEVGLTPESVKNTLQTIGTYWPGVLMADQGRDAFEDMLFGEEKSSLPFFCRDMNSQAEGGEFMEITGRDNEIQRLIHILSRKTKNNPILVGDAGVGKTAVVQGFVQLINKNKVPPSFVGKRVLSLDIASIMAGSKVRGDLEERIMAVVNDAISDGNKILFIDEIHMIVGAGSQGGRDAMDIANILKPYLTDPRLRIIGATTLNEYRKFFEEDAALSRRFQQISVDELDRESALKILHSLRPEFESYHMVKIKPEAVDAAVNLSYKFIPDRYLPDKAIDVLDEAAASVKIGVEVQIEPELSSLGNKIMTLQKRKEEAIASNNLAEAYRIKMKEEEIGEQLEELIEGKGKHSKRKRTVDASLVQQVVVNWTKIPLAAATIDNKKLKGLREEISKRIVGQDHVLDGVIDTLKRSHLGLGDSKRPLASFLFLGPTGVGKTELAKVVARELFGAEELLVQLNMSEYMEMHSVAKLIGSPPGYVGYQDGGQLTEQIRRRPYSVVLFDEVEKAHPEVLNILLQILEEGTLQDGRGRKASFQNTVIIMTSNIGAEDVAKDSRLGFDISLEDVKKDDLDEAFEQMRETLLESLRAEVRPEILNRLDNILVFRGLNEKDCLEITQLLVNNLVLSLMENSIMLNVPKSIVKHINSEGYAKEYGARNLRRKIQELLENGLANYLLDNGVKLPKKGMVKVNTELKGKAILFSKGK